MLNGIIILNELVDLISKQKKKYTFKIPVNILECLAKCRLVVTKFPTQVLFAHEDCEECTKPRSWIYLRQLYTVISGVIYTVVTKK